MNNELMSSTYTGLNDIKNALDEVKEYIIPQSSFSKGALSLPVKVIYISDLHLDSHLEDANIDFGDKKRIVEYIDDVVKRLLDKYVDDIIYEGITPSTEKELIQNGYYYLFEKNHYNLSREQLSELERQLINDVVVINVVPYLETCVCFLGDISANIDLVELFFQRMLLFLDSYDDTGDLDEMNYESDYDISNNTIHFCPFYYILGNHELSSYCTVEEAVDEYSSMLSKYNIVVLQNEMLSFNNCVIIGGTGFAKYNDKYNANTIIGPENMRNCRRMEATETDLFVEKYKLALIESTKKNIPIIVISHYPVSDWLNEKTSSKCYYFFGHNHHNKIINDDACHIYADNQIGYTDLNISLKSVQVGTMYNPFIDYSDGFYEITTEQYHDFYNYSGEYVKVRNISNYISKGDKFYLIKRNSFYGFFLIGKKNTKICFGGSVKIVSDIIDINYYYDAFSLMIYSYIVKMLPLRRLQEQIAYEIKSLNIPCYNSGNIHGTIVDVDFYHHIMINPFDGTITYYYSPIFGMVKQFDSIEALLQSVSVKLLEVEYQHTCDLVSAINELPKDSIIIKSKIEVESYIKDELTQIDIKNSLYKYSSRVNQLQRLFSSNILRDWNDSLISRYMSEDYLKKYQLKEKKLTPYNMVQKHWKNLMLIDSNKIDEKLVKCALNLNRKCYFPYQEIQRQYGIDFPDNRLSDEEIKEFIYHIPLEILKNSFPLFHEALGNEVLCYYPLEVLDYKQINSIMSKEFISNKEKISIVSKIPSNEWTDDLIMSLSVNINLNNRPKYCSAELWNKIKRKK